MNRIAEAFIDAIVTGMPAFVFCGSFLIACAVVGAVVWLAVKGSSR